MNFQTITVSGDEALAALGRYRADYRRTGIYPFLIRDAEEIDRIRETAECNEYDATAIGEALEAAATLDLAAWGRRRREEAEEFEWVEAGIIGDWPGEISNKGSISAHCDIASGEINKEAYLGLVRVEHPWHVPAAVGYGDWNDCPGPAVQCAWHRQWHQHFGAEIVSLSGDVIECMVSRPPRTHEEAMRIAWEQYWYCMDIVEQGTGTVSALAATLLNSNYWFFWWD